MYWCTLLRVVPHRLIFAVSFHCLDRQTAAAFVGSKVLHTLLKVLIYQTACSKMLHLDLLQHVVGDYNFERTVFPWQISLELNPHSI